MHVRRRLDLFLDSPQITPEQAHQLVPTVVPSVADIGAVLLAANGYVLSISCTENTPGSGELALWKSPQLATNLYRLSSNRFGRRSI